MFTPARLVVLLVGLASVLFIVAHSSADNGPDDSAATTGKPAASEVAEAEEAADAAGAAGDDGWPDVRSISSFNDGALDEIKGCIANLGHADFKVRSAAEERLVEIGRPAKALLQEAVGNDDPEVAFRAGRALEAVEKNSQVSAGLRNQLRTTAREAVDRGDYAAAAREFVNIIRLAPPALVDICELGLVCEMAGRWEDAAIAYGLAAAKAEVWREASNSKPGSWNGKIPEAPYDFSEWSYVSGRWRKVADSPFPPEKLDQNQKQLLSESRGTDSSWDNERYSRLMLLLGRIQRDRLNDATAAAKSFASGARYFRRHEDNDAKALATLYNVRTAALADGKLVAPREPHAPRHPNWLLCLLELAAIEEQVGRPAEALAAWGRINMAAANYKFHRDPVDHQAVTRLAARLPDDQPLPPGVPVIRLSAKNPHWTFNPADAETISRARRFPGDAPPKFTFALVAPESAQFQSLEISCQFGEAVSGANLDAGLLIRAEALMQRQFWTTAAPIGEVRLDAQTPDERQVTRSFDVPPGAGVVQLGIGGWDARPIQSVTVKARFAPAAAKEQPAASYIAGHGYPEGGKLTIDGRKFEGRVLRQAVAEPGRHLLQYVGPDAKAKMQIEADLRPGQVYAFAALLDSPFTVRQTNLPAADPQADDQFAHCGLVQLGNGQWLTAWESRGRIMLALSDDLQRWGEPHPLPLMVTANETAPTLVCDGAGGAWISWISERTSLTMPGRKALVMAHTADGVKWDPPHAIIAPGDAQKPPQLVNIGSQWQLYRANYRGVADSPDKIEKFHSFMVVGSRPDELHVAIDDTGRKHMVFAVKYSAGGNRINPRLFHTMSADGETWDQCTDLFGPARDNGQLSNPQLIIRGDRMLLFYEEDGDLYLRHTKVAEQPKFGAAARLTGGAMRPAGTRPTVTVDGKVVFLCGPHGVWLMQADLKKLLTDDASQPAAAAAATEPMPGAGAVEAAAGNYWKVFTWGQARRGRIVAADRHAIWLKEPGRITRYDQKSRQFRHFTVADGLPLECSPTRLYADGNGGCLMFYPRSLYLYGQQGWTKLAFPFSGENCNAALDATGNILLVLRDYNNTSCLLGYSRGNRQWRKIRDLPFDARGVLSIAQGWLFATPANEIFLLPHGKNDISSLGKCNSTNFTHCVTWGDFVLNPSRGFRFTEKGAIPIKEHTMFDLQSGQALPLKVTISKKGPGQIESDVFGTIEMNDLTAYRFKSICLLRDMNGDIWLDGELIKSDLTVQPPIDEQSVRPVPAEFVDFSAWDAETQCAWVIRNWKDKSMEYRDFSGSPSKLLRKIAREQKWRLPRFVDRQGNWWLITSGSDNPIVRIDSAGGIKKFTLPDGRRVCNDTLAVSPLSGTVWVWTTIDPEDKITTPEERYRYAYLDRQSDEFVVSDRQPWDDFAFTVGRYELAVISFPPGSFWYSCYRKTADGRWDKWAPASTLRLPSVTANSCRADRLLIRNDFGAWEYDGEGDRWICLAGWSNFASSFDEKGRRVLATYNGYRLIYEGDPFDDPYADAVSSPKLQQETRHLLDLARAAHPLMRQEIVRRFVGLPAVSAMIVDSYRERGLIDEELAAELFAVISKDAPPGLFELAHPPCPVLGQ